MSLVLAWPMLGTASLLLLALALWQGWRSRTLDGPRRLIALLCRAVLLLSLGAAAGGVSLERIRPDRRVVWDLLDVSSSVPPAARRSALETLLAAARRRDPALVSHGLILWAGNPVVAVAPDGVALPPDAARLPAGLVLEDAALHDVRDREWQAAASRRREVAGGAGESPEPPDERRLALAAFRASLDPDRSRLAPALDQVRSLAVSAGTGLRVEVWTDGHLEQTAAIALSPWESEGRPVVLHPLTDVTWRDAVLDSVETPAEVRADEPFIVRIRGRAGYGGRGTLALFIDDACCRETAVAFDSSAPFTAAFPPVEVEEGTHVLRAVLEAEGDGQRRNNMAIGAVIASQRPTVLCVEGREHAADAIASAVAAQGWGVTRRPAASTHDTLRDLLGFDAVLLVEAGPDSLTPVFGQALRAYVAEQGGGCVAVLGPDEGRIAAWRGTWMADLLPCTLPEPPPTPPDPVPSPPPPATGTGGPPPAPPVAGGKTGIAPGEASVVALVLVLDRSGSMQEENRIGLAKEATIAAASTLSAQDLVGVIAFDAQPRWVTELGPASDLTALTDRVSRLTAAGGTNIFPALAEAWRALGQVDASVKHVILLTDGYTNPPQDYERLVTSMAAEKVTVSTVGIGDDFDSRLLANLSQWGKGRFYFTDKNNEIPEIFTLEARRAIGIARPAPPEGPGGIPPAPPVPAIPEPPATGSKLPVPPGGGERPVPPGGGERPVPPGGGERPVPPGGGERPVPPPGYAPAPLQPVHAGPPSPLLPAVPVGEWPALGGIVPVTAKANAVAPLATVGEAPVLLMWRTGLGRVGCWAAGFAGEGAAKWTEWPRFPGVIGQVLRGCARPGRAIAWQPVFEPVWEGESVRLGVRVPDLARQPDAALEVRLLVAPTERAAKPGEVRRVGRERFESVLPAPAPGQLMLAAWWQRAPDGGESITRVALGRAFPAELGTPGVREVFFSEEAPAAGALGPDAAPSLWIPPKGTRRETRPLSSEALLLALLLIPIDVAVRRWGR